MRILATVMISVLAGVGYRMGGSGNYPFYFRELAAALALIAVFAIWGYVHWSVILSAGALYGLETTYFKKKGTDAKWFNWALVGLAFSCAVVPVVLVFHLYHGFLARTIICTTLVVMWSEMNGNAVWEEGGRGIIPIATIPILFI